MPAGLGGRLPRQVDQVGPALTRPAELGLAADYLRSAITAPTHDVYVALALTAVATLAGALVIVSPAVRHQVRDQCQRRARRPGRSGRAAPSAGAGPRGPPGSLERENSGWRARSRRKIQMMGERGFAKLLDLLPTP